MLSGDFQAAARLHDRIVPIEVIRLKLDEIHFGMRRQQGVERLCAVMHGKADVADFSLGFHFAHEIPHVVFVEFRRACAADVVQQVIVDVVDAEALEGRFEIRLRGTCVGRGPGKAFRRDGIGFTRVAIHERFAQCAFRGAVMVYEGGVEIRPASLDERIDHAFEMLDVDARRIVSVEQRQAHAAESESRGVSGSFAHDVLPFRFVDNPNASSAVQVKKSDAHFSQSRCFGGVPVGKAIHMLARFRRRLMLRPSFFLEGDFRKRFARHSPRMRTERVGYSVSSYCRGREGI